MLILNSSGNYTFSHDWQLHWILAHKTLERLILDDCHILTYICQYGEIDHEKYAVKPTLGWGQKHTWKYDGQWSRYFVSIREELPKLKSFAFGSGEWNEGRNFDGKPWKVLGIYPEMYMTFNRGIGPTLWQTIEEFSTDLERDQGNSNSDQSFEATQDHERDKEAYDELMKVVHSR
jgi:hypothetical protein